MQPVIYRRRRGALARSEREWRVEPDALVVRLASGREHAYRWADIVSIRLYAEPARRRPWRYVFELQPRHRRRIAIDNAHCVSAGVFEDCSASYTPFVRAAAERLAAANPKARALIAETKKRYLFLLVAALVALGAAAFAVAALPTPFDAWRYAAPAKFALIVAMLPLFWLIVMRAMPRGVPLDAIPDRALPPRPDLRSAPRQPQTLG